MIDLRQLPNIYQRLYHDFYQNTRHKQEGLDRDGSSTQLREEEEEAEAAALKADESAVGMVKEAMEDSA